MKHNRFLIAAFDEWEALGKALAELGAERMGRVGALLHIRKDEPPTLTAPWLIRDVTELRFSALRERVRCTAGTLAEALARRSAGGARDLAGALGGWLSSEQAREVQWHVEKGRIVLWLEPPTADDMDAACAQLAQASPHLVELSDTEGMDAPALRCEKPTASIIREVGGGHAVDSFAQALLQRARHLSQSVRPQSSEVRTFCALVP